MKNAETISTFLRKPLLSILNYYYQNMSFLGIITTQKTHFESSNN